MSGGGAVWSALAERATLSGVDLSELPRSAFLAEVVDDMIEREMPGTERSPLSFCTHLGATEEGDLPDLIVFTGQAFCCCPRCAADFRTELEAARHRVCIRCDVERATAIHRAEVGAEPGMSLVLFAVQLCEACAVAEGLRGTDLAVSP
ncbi:hypothetical protein [Microbacterium sp.]|uniref:hypothetical protein n=1 Tax=Microbacterium sp. TaxID=51671 RepID=UPI0026293225|nr:hypothetical protein [Microbacterium sp.]MCV0334558.1 hypothetical protein [Microbacterium sp.]MCV0376256.1 hypothetical protein [Microbacterium sp.]MCV0389815.1 hypothetical protein [Microbacterium sp.]MCV0419350.1 hypothetical protein [Microbacterium sp.]MCV0421655.1 hypothetical protein [Microbacterium sp.]